MGLWILLIIQLPARIGCDRLASTNQTATEISCVALRKSPPSDSRYFDEALCTHPVRQTRGAPKKKTFVQENIEYRKARPSVAGRIRQRGRAGDPTYCLTRTIHECGREAFETEARRGCSHVRPTQAYVQSVEEAEREQPRRATGSDAEAGIYE